MRPLPSRIIIITGTTIGIITSGIDRGRLVSDS
jgi:hypothetical protein